MLYFKTAFFVFHQIFIYSDSLQTSFSFIFVAFIAWSRKLIRASGYHLLFSLLRSSIKLIYFGNSHENTHFFPDQKYFSVSQLFRVREHLPIQLILSDTKYIVGCVVDVVEFHPNIHFLSQQIWAIWQSHFTHISPIWTYYRLLKRVLYRSCDSRSH